MLTIAGDTSCGLSKFHLLHGESRLLPERILVYVAFLWLLSSGTDWTCRSITQAHCLLAGLRTVRSREPCRLSMCMCVPFKASREPPIPNSFYLLCIVDAFLTKLVTTHQSIRKLSLSCEHPSRVDMKAWNLELYLISHFLQMPECLPLVASGM